MEQKFLRQYLATRLNAEAGRLYPDGHHNITSIKGYAYLGLLDSTQATLSDIIHAIEGKYETSPTEDQFETMKDICEALNELKI